MDKKPIDLGFDWFKYHAGQRIAMIRFFVTLSFGVATAISYLIAQKSWFGSSLLSIALILISVIFWQIDVRSRQLIEIGEKIIEQHWDSVGGDPILNPVVASRAQAGQVLRYRQAFGILFLLGGLFGVAALIYSATLVRLP